MTKTYDHARRRRSQRQGRQAGCLLYVPAEELRKAGFGPDEPPPYYRTWAGPRGRLVVQLYREG